MTAAALADKLEVATRTVYRDIAALQAQRVPIEGAAGIGYMLRGGFDLPPLMFTADEIDAIAVGARLIRRLRDPGLQRAANQVLDKIATVLPEALRTGVTEAPYFVSDGSAEMPEGIDPAAIRRAIRDSHKMRITYVDSEGRVSERTVWPLALAYYVNVTVIGAWCELRGDIRHFRVERIKKSEILESRFTTDSDNLTERWQSLQGWAQSRA